MRIRSIHPEFWRSEDVAGLTWGARLVFIGLWSYVDDNGVGRDVERLIVADLFPLERDPRETLATVSGALQNLSEGGQIDRYEVAGKPFLHITSWAKWQRIDKPGKARYPAPTCENAIPRETLATLSGDLRETPAPGEGEKGRRGEGEKNSCSPADAGSEIDSDFEAWYAEYPRKRGKGQAAKSYRSARKKASARQILDALLLQRSALVTKGAEFAPYPATWLNGERWLDEPDSNVRQLPAADPNAWMRRRPTQ